MPDGDRFERALRGSWRFPYRIAAAGASAERVAEQLATACLSLVTDDVRSCSRKMMTALDGAFVHNSMPLFFGEPQNTAFQRLTRGLDLIAAEHHFDEFAQSCGRAISRCFLGLEHESHISDERLEQRFARELITEMAGRHFFPMVRDRLSENTGRDAATQRLWEGKVVESMTENVQVFSQALFADQSERRTKRHVRIAPASTFDWNRLNEPLHVLGA
jgi:hypothetical protein